MTDEEAGTLLASIHIFRTEEGGVRVNTDELNDLSLADQYRFESVLPDLMRDRFLHHLAQSCEHAAMMGDPELQRLIDEAAKEGAF